MTVDYVQLKTKTNKNNNRQNISVLANKYFNLKSNHQVYWWKTIITIQIYLGVVALDMLLGVDMAAVQICIYIKHTNIISLNLYGWSWWKIVNETKEKTAKRDKITLVVVEALDNRQPLNVVQDIPLMVALELLSLSLPQVLCQWIETIKLNKQSNKWLPSQNIQTA